MNNNTIEKLIIPLRECSLEEECSTQKRRMSMQAKLDHIKWVYKQSHQRSESSIHKSKMTEYRDLYLQQQRKYKPLKLRVEALIKNGTLTDDKEITEIRKIINLYEHGAKGLKKELY